MYGCGVLNKLIQLILKSEINIKTFLIAKNQLSIKFKIKVMNLKTSSKKIGFLLFLSLSALNFIFAQKIDVSFNHPETEIVDVTRFNQYDAVVRCIVQQPDGKILLGGGFRKYNGRNRSNIVRLNADGSIDEEFIVNDGFEGRVETIVLQSDGKILVGGQFNSYNGTEAGYIIRLNNNGTIDRSFKTGSGFNGHVNCMLVQPDGKILVGGKFSGYDNNRVNRLARLNTDGSMDVSLVFPYGFDGSINALAFHKGKVLIGGNFSRFDNVRVNSFVKMGLGGAIDIKFNISGVGFPPNSVVNTIIVQDDDRIILGGRLVSYNGNRVGDFIRLGENGWIDKKFNTNLAINNTNLNYINALSLDKNGNIYAGGNFSSIGGEVYSGFVYTDNNGFPIKGTGGDKFGQVVVNAIQVLKDGTVMIGGLYTAIAGFSRNAIAAFENGKIVENKYVTSYGLDGPVLSMSRTPDNNFFVTGRFMTYNNEYVNGIIKIDSLGKRDKSFNFPSEYYQGVEVRAINKQSTGKYIIIGGFEGQENRKPQRILRLNSNGDLDEAFFSGKLSGEYRHILIQPDDKIILAGDFTDFDGVKQNGILRLTPNGSLDNTFKTSSSFYIKSKQAILQEDGKILVVGEIRESSSNNYLSGIIRLLPNGQLDPSFPYQVFQNSNISYIKQTPQGDYYLAGDFAFGNERHQGILKFTSNWKVDPTFKLDKSIGVAGKEVCVIEFLPNNHLLVGFKQQPFGNTIPINNTLIKVDPDGVLDKSFRFSTSFEGNFTNNSHHPIISSIIVNNNSFFVGGSFTFIDGHHCFGIAKISLQQNNKEVNKNSSVNNSSSNAGSKPAAPLSNLAKALFNGLKSKLTNEEKNLLAKAIDNFKVGKNGTDYYLVNDSDDMKKDDDDLIGVDISVFPIDLNNDAKDEIIIQMSSSMFGRDGAPLYVYALIGNKFIKVLDGLGYSLDVNTASKEKYRELAIYSAYGNNKKADGQTFTIYRFLGQDYQIINKSKLLTPPKWEKLESLSAKYQAAIK